MTLTLSQLSPAFLLFKWFSLIRNLRKFPLYLINFSWNLWDLFQPQNGRKHQVNMSNMTRGQIFFGSLCFFWIIQYDFPFFIFSTLNFTFFFQGNCKIC